MAGGLLFLEGSEGQGTLLWPLIDSVLVVVAITISGERPSDMNKNLNRVGYHGLLSSRCGCGKPKKTWRGAAAGEYKKRGDVVESGFIIEKFPASIRPFALHLPRIGQCQASKQTNVHGLGGASHPHRLFRFFSASIAAITTTTTTPPPPPLLSSSLGSWAHPEIHFSSQRKTSVPRSASESIVLFMPPIVAPEERASLIPASPAEKPFPRGFVAAVPTSPTPSTPLNPPALQPPPPSHYLRNRNRNSGDSDLFIKRSEIYTRVQRVLPSASYAEDSTSGLLFGSDFHADWANTRLGRSTLPGPRCVVASPIHAAHTPAAPLSAEPLSVIAQSNPFSNSHTILSPRARDEDNALEISPSMPASEASKERPCRRAFRTLLRQRLTVKVASRSVEAAFATQPSSSTDDLPRHHSPEL
jgi:hypothetical protein